jgi:hypothetical protein
VIAAEAARAFTPQSPMTKPFLRLLWFDLKSQPQRPRRPRRKANRAESCSPKKAKGLDLEPGAKTDQAVAERAFAPV